MTDLPEIPTLEWALRSHPQDLQLLREIEAVFDYQHRGLQRELTAQLGLRQYWQDQCNKARTQIDVLTGKA